MRWSLISVLLVSLPALTSAACDGSGGGTGGSGATGGSGGAAGTSTSGGAGGAAGGTAGGGGALQPGECREHADCDENGSFCAVGGPSYCGGAGCLLTACASDGDCQSMGLYVCEPVDCCGGTYCIPGCDADDPCPVGQTCTADNHCVAQPCGGEACPANFDCGSGAEPTCARRPCGSDADCEGYCVLGGCHDKLGFCDLPKP
jgi:hypothetical protein